ncbi:FAD-dependent oxidoreductase [Actinomadura sp. HBU206391]|uniref:FAD-dependent oxidoreductase n=1 Tax=Actinomadura sp. HBU206391 TaxID=2731692 RepID=UPI00164EDAFC|nr:FAD-dependent oxidoreductase [Actinomadura sp. HBU206391]MBC6458937.1 FAD-dependent oxidoreductase [Actinomadura sp. HBU206391]
MTTAEQAPLRETPDSYGAYPRLTEEQIELLARFGARHPKRAGETLYREGDQACDFHVILSGKVMMVEGYGLEDRVISVHGAGRFLGELNLLTDQAVLLTAVMGEPGEVLTVPVAHLRDLAMQDPNLGDQIMRACLIRRSILIGLGTGFRIVGSRYSPDTRRLREFAARNRLPHRWIDLEQDKGAEAVLRRLGITPEETPVVILGAEHVLRNPTNAELARALGLPAPCAGNDVCDLIVVGAGPAGLAASVYGASEGMATVALDAVATGGQAGTTSRIENYLGFPAGISGSELADRAVIQAEKFGARISVPADATALEEHEGYHAVRLSDGTTITGRTVVIATGVCYRRLPLPRLEEFEGVSVYYAATVAEAQSCRNDPVAVVGGGNSAGQATLFLAQHSAPVRLLIRGGDLAKDMSRYLVDRIEHCPQVEVLLHTEVRELIGEKGSLEALKVENNQSGERSMFQARALFVFIGATPHTDWLAGQLSLDDHGFVLTGPAADPTGEENPSRIGRAPLPLETSRPGVFAVGDVRSGSIKRMASAVGEGSMAIRLVHEYLQGAKEPVLS